MKNIRMLHAVGILVLVLCIASCSSCKDKTPEKVYITNEELARATTFKEGSYFIYQKDGTNEIDSYYLESYQRYFPYDNSEATVISEYLSSIFFIKTLPQEPSKYITFFYQATDPSEIQIKFNADRYKVAFKLPFIENNTYVRYSDQVVSCLNLKPMHTVNGVSYTDVYVINCAEPDSTSVTTYFSFEAGLVEYVITTPIGQSDWKLIKENIIK